jgi:hypothetical protein
MGTTQDRSALLSDLTPCKSIAISSIETYNRMTRILEAAQSAALAASNSEIVAQLLRDLPGNERNALRDYYARNGEESQICARYCIAPDAFQNLKSTLRAQFRDLRNAQPRKPVESARARNTALSRIA